MITCRSESAAAPPSSATAPAHPPASAPHHTPGFHVEDTDLEAGVKAFVALVLGYAWLVGVGSRSLDTVKDGVETGYGDTDLFVRVSSYRDWIDSITPTIPVWVQRLDGHMGLANSVALRMAGITRETPDPPGGTIVAGTRATGGDTCAADAAGAGRAGAGATAAGIASTASPPRCAARSPGRRA